MIPMSSSFTDQPSPRDPRRDERLTPTPPAPERSREEDDVEGVCPAPKLGSLAQKARGKKLKEARGILLFIGILTILVNGAVLYFAPSLVEGTIKNEVARQGGPARVDPVSVQQARDRMLMIEYAITGSFFAMGVLFVIFGVLVYRFPLAMTITSLVLYLLATVAMAALNPVGLATGSFIRIIIIVALAKSIHSAYVYERERRAEEEQDLISGELS
jgi:hypothetical protein